MLQKVMIICLVLSFVFFGGIAFAGNGHGPRDGTGEGDGTGEHGPGDCSFTSSDCSIIIARNGNDKENGDQDRLRDDSCLPFTSHDSTSIIIAECDGDGIPDLPQDGTGKQLKKGQSS